MSKTWNGEGMSQEDFMHKDQCILLDNDDNIIGSGSKYDSHVFSEDTPRGMLHRAFSVFLFNSEGKLMLQQRASDKITFPNVWTNTCCSHPLTGYEPCEVDQPCDVADGTVMGVKHAAVRKLAHELGIKAEDVPIENFKFLTRLHYWAADVVTHGKKSPWGEHEIDYILFIQIPTKTIEVNLNKEEVSDIKYVSYDELRRLMKPATKLLWSPWFRIITEQFLVHWWKDLNVTLTTNEFVDVKNIYRFDPTKEHMGGGGNAQTWLGKAAQYRVANFSSDSTATSSANTSASIAVSSKDNGAAGLKQGGYGKIKIHGHSKLSQLMHIDEIFAALYLKINGLPNKMELVTESDRFCEDMLVKVSRSFAAVIQQLPKDLCKDIMVFYLVLRALDTIEDDMEAFKGREHEKLEYLNTFYTKLDQDGWNMQDVGEADEKTLLEQFHHVVTVFRGLPHSSQDVIRDITKRMGQGMASFVERDLGEGTVSKADYNLYCHYVAGMIGEGLSKLFNCTGYESTDVAAAAKTTANTMGLFLQKTNIIRDYLEDYTDGRTFYPQEVWKKYSVTGELGEFTKMEAKERAVWLLNDLVTDALECVPECLEYMDLLQTEETFRFCAIPQVMAIATLNELYGNHKVFTGVVKIRKGQAAKLILETTSNPALHKWFNVFANDIMSRVKENDPNAEKTRAICTKIIALTSKNAWTQIAGTNAAAINMLSPVVLAVCSLILWREVDFTTVTNPLVLFTSETIHLTTQIDIVALLLSVAAIMYMLGYAIVSTSRKGLKKGDHYVQY